MSRVAIYGSGLDSEVLAALEGEGWQLIACEDGGALLETVVERRPNAVIVTCTSPSDLGLLQLVRRAAPHVPLILIASEGDLDLQRRLRDVRPYYYDVMPLDPTALREAVRAAVARPAR